MLSWASCSTCSISASVPSLSSAYSAVQVDAAERGDVLLDREQFEGAGAGGRAEPRTALGVAQQRQARLGERPRVARRYDESRAADDLARPRPRPWRPSPARRTSPRPGRPGSPRRRWTARRPRPPRRRRRGRAPPGRRSPRRRPGSRRRRARPPPRRGRAGRRAPGSGRGSPRPPGPAPGRRRSAAGPPAPAGGSRRRRAAARSGPWRARPGRPRPACPASARVLRSRALADLRERRGVHARVDGAQLWRGRRRSAPASGGRGCCRG